MKHIHYLSASLLIPALMGLSSCVSTDQPEQEGAPVVEQQSNHREDYTNVIPGTLVVKLTPEQLASYRKGGSTSVTRALSSEAAYWPETLGEITMTPLFLDEDAFRERRHRAGLDRWMIVTYKGQVPSHKAKALVEASESFEAVELQWLWPRRSLRSPPSLQSSSESSVPPGRWTASMTPCSLPVALLQ